jgi:hypothetical protein
MRLSRNASMPRGTKWKRLPKRATKALAPGKRDRKLRVRTAEGVKTFRSVSAAAKAFGVKVSTVFQRLTRGYSPEEAVGLRRRRAMVKHTALGKQFESLAEAAASYGISATQVYQRLERGMTLSQALAAGPNNLTHRRVHVVTPSGDQVFPTLTAACTAFNVPRGLVSQRLRMGWRIDEALGATERIKTGKPLAVDLVHEGVRYLFRSRAEAETQLGIGRGLIRYRLERGWSLAQALELRPPPQDAKIDAIGYVYAITHKKSRMQYVGQTMLPVRKRWEEHIDIARNQRFGHSRPLYAAIRRFGPKAFTIKRLAIAKTRPELDALERRWIRQLGSVAPAGFNRQRGGAGASWGHKVEVAGVTYPSVAAAARAHGKHGGNVHSRLQRGWSLEEALGVTQRATPWNAPRRCKVRVNGKVISFPTHAAAARAFGVCPSVLSVRLKAGLSMSKALKRFRKSRSQRPR